MGQTIARARKATSAAEGGSKIAYNAVNENLLNKIMDWLSGYAGAHPAESKLKFKSAISWQSSLKIDDLSGGAFEQRYVTCKVLLGSGVRLFLSIEVSTSRYVVQLPI